jgi:hypothetical protein
MIGNADATQYEYQKTEEKMVYSGLWAPPKTSSAMDTNVKSEPNKDNDVGVLGYGTNYYCNIVFGGSAGVPIYIIASDCPMADDEIDT